MNTYKNWRFHRRLPFLYFGLTAGFSWGLIKAVSEIIKQKYLLHKTYLLALSEITTNIQVGILFGALASGLLILFLRGLHHFFAKPISRTIEIKILHKNNLGSLIRRILLLSALVLTLLLAARSLLMKKDHLEHLANPALVIFMVLLISLVLTKINIISIRSHLSKPEYQRLLRNSSWVSLTFVALVSLLWFGKAVFSRPSGPNVLLIVADTLRADHLGCYGYENLTSPSIDSFATESVLFERAFSNASWTTPSMGSLLTSLYPHEHGAFGFHNHLKKAVPTMAEVFRNAGYTTFCVQTNIHLTKSYDFGHGFDQTEEVMLAKGEEVASLFMTWLEKRKEGPFFAYLHFMDTHFPYNAPGEMEKIFNLEIGQEEFITTDIRLLSKMGISDSDKQKVIRLYDDAVTYFDGCFQKISEVLKSRDIYENTIIVLVSDHGEEFWEHGGYAHGHSLYNEVIRVPLIIRYPPIFSPKSYGANIALTDIMPTILGAADIPHFLDLSGDNRIGSILNDTRSEKEIFVEALLTSPEKKALIKDDLKLIENTGILNEDIVDILGILSKHLIPREKAGFELYHLSEDSSETRNIVADFPDTVENMKKSLRIFKWKSFDDLLEMKPQKEGRVEKLKSLGYMK